MLQVNGVSYFIGERQILNGVTFSLSQGEKAALVGVNGAGKSTLLKIIVGELPLLEGSVLKPDLVSYVPQVITDEIAVNKETTLGEFMLEGRNLNKIARDLYKALDAMAHTSLSGKEMEAAINRLSELQEQFLLAGGYDAENEIETILQGVGVPLDLNCRVSSLSGGEKTRLAFARAIFSDGDLLILDEPTNHIDMQYYGWLGKYLHRSKKTILVVSHHLEFVNPFTERILEIEKFTGRIREYHGNYQEYLVQSRANEEVLARGIDWLDKEITRLRTSALRLQYGGPNKAKAAQNMFGRIERLEKQRDEVANEIPRRERKMRFLLNASRRSGYVVAKAMNLAKSFTRPLFKGVSFEIYRGEKIVVLGPNGSGKTTLIRIMMGFLLPDSGQIEFGTNVTLGYYAQEHDDLNFDATVIAEVNAASTINFPNVRDVLGRFLFSQNKVFQKVGTLSLGEKSRLSLCKLIVCGHNLLILDEPTYYLDLESRDAVAEAIQDYDGTVVIASHDSEFVRLVKPNKAIIMPSGKMQLYSEELLDS